MSDPTCWGSLRDWYEQECRALGVTEDDVKKAYTEETGRQPWMLRHYFKVSQFEIPTEEIYKKVYQGRLGFRRTFEDLRAEYETLRGEYEGKRAGYESKRPTHIVDEMHTNVFDVPVVQSANRGSGHVCEKPQRILRRLIRCGTHPGDIVVDPFMGGGSAGVAAVSEGRGFIGNDLDPKWYRVAREWIEAENAQIRLF